MIKLTQKTEKIIVVLTALLILLVVNVSIYHKEQHINQGESLYLELAPVDPRSLMQGDYMTLNYAINQAIRQHLQSKNSTDISTHSKLNYFDGKAVVTVNKQGVAKFSRIDNGGTLAHNEKRINFRARQHSIKIASNAFFFQEGTAKLYDKAKYAHVRLNKHHDPLLVGLLDEALNKIQPVPQNSSKSE